MKHVGIAIITLYIVLMSLTAAAEYPEKPVRLVIGFVAGGPADAAARVLGKSLSRSTGQQVIVDSRPGASGAVAAKTVLSAAPDGYTLLWAAASMVAIPQLQKNSSFQSLAQFTPVSTTCDFAYGMFAYPGVPAGSVADFIKHVRANGEQVHFAAASLGEYLAAAQFMKATGTRMTRVAYKGGAQVMPDLIAGRVEVFFTPAAVALPYVKDNRLRMLGTLLPQRAAAAPDVPTMAESGLAGVTVPSWQAIVGPPNMPQPVVHRLMSEVQLALQDPEVRTQYGRMVFHPRGSTPKELTVTIDKDVETWRTFIRDNDIPVE